MHEAAVAHAILRRALQTVYPPSSATDDLVRCASRIDENEGALEKEPDINVIRILIDVGEFRNIDPESLEFAFTSLRKEFASTRNAKLEIRPVKALAICTIHEHEYRPTADQYFSCTSCGGGIKKLILGEELNIVSIEIENKPTAKAGRSTIAQR
ncbi:MAG: hydrogenase maturation nickel metallochaperone HypA [Candidatus Obscuribacterales bacterium]|nr:hydrogenase maturation nickel metallochaperone HypA [Candidatus Obscuribacterales bacterium]